jgi:acetyl-CoA carboxylase carboxyl transferase subunit beta
LNLPLVTIVDTPGAELSVEAEEGGLAGQIARCLAELMAVPVPTVSVLVGMGCGAGAIALLPADTVVAAELSWVSPLPLEGASVIRHRTPDRAAEMAEQQRVTAGFMAADGFVDVLVAEESAATGSAQSGRLVEEIGDAVATALTDLTNLDQSDRELRRRRRYSGGLV